MNRGSLPTRLVFLSELSKLPDYTKVRFLGCVTSYSLSTGTMTLQHAYPALPSTCASIEVDVGLLLENLKSTDTQVGEWVNITGYVQHRKHVPTMIQKNHVGGDQKPTATMGSSGEERGAKQTANEVNVQAVMLWSAGGVKLGEYEKSLESRRFMERESPNAQRTAGRC